MILPLLMPAFLSLGDQSLGYRSSGNRSLGYLSLGYMSRELVNLRFPLPSRVHR